MGRSGERVTRNDGEAMAVSLNRLLAGEAEAPVWGGLCTPVLGITDDSRLVEPGWAFVARRGSVEDGAAYIDQAWGLGARVVIAESPPPTGWTPDAREGGERTWVRLPRLGHAEAGRLAERFYGEPSRRLKVIGVTGTNGKTTTAYVIRHLLKEAGVRCGLIGTVSVDVGAGPQAAALTTPGAVELSRLLAEMVGNGCGACVLEASSHALDQGRVAAVGFDVGVFTNLSGDHLDYHGDMDRYAAAKAALFGLLEEDGCAVVNGDDPYCDRVLEGSRCRVVRCGVGNDPVRGGASDGVARARVHEMSMTRSDVRLDGPWGELMARLPMIGDHNVMNVLQAVAAVDALGVAVNGEAIESFGGVPGRLERVEVEVDGVEGDDRPLVLVDYAHTHDALENVLRAVRPVVEGRLIVVFGCGGDRDRSKRAKMGRVAWELADVVVVTSDNPRTEEPGAIIEEILGGVPGGDGRDGRLYMEEDRAEAIRLAIGMAGVGDAVLLAGKGHEDYQVIGKEKRAFDDREHAAAALKAWQG